MRGACPLVMEIWGIYETIFYLALHLCFNIHLMFIDILITNLELHVLPILEVSK